MKKTKSANLSSMRRVLFSCSLTLVTLSTGCDQDVDITDDAAENVDSVQDQDQEQPIKEKLVQANEPVVSGGAPAIDTKCSEQLSLKTPKNGSGVEFNSDCSVAYVLPPIVGTTKAGNFSPNQNMGFCEAAQNAQKVGVSTMKSAAKMADRLANAGEKLDALSEKVQIKQDELDRVTSAFNAGTAEVAVAQSKLKNFRDDYKGAKRALEDCKMEAIDAKEECKEELLEAKKALRAFQDQRDTVDDLELAVSKAQAQKNQLEKEIERLGEKLLKDQKTHAEIQELLLSLNARVMNLYKEYAVLEGAMGNMYYLLEWDKLLEDYRLENPEFKQRFAPMPLDDLRFHIATHVGESVTLPALLGVNVPGLGKLVSQSSELSVSDEPVSIDPANTGLNPSAVHRVVRGGNSNGAHVALSLVGACPGYDEATESIDPKLLDSFLSTKISYSFQVQAKRQYAATYNMSSWLDSMEKIKKETRPFSSKNLREVASSAASSNWFRIDFSGNHADFDYTPEEQAEIKKEVADTLQANALKQLAHQTGVDLPPVPRAKLSKAGLQKWAKRKKTLCGFFTWCVYTNYAGKLLSDVWSNKEGIAKFKRSNSVWQSYEVSGTKMIRRYGSAIFMLNEGADKPSSDLSAEYQHKLENSSASRERAPKEVS